MTEKDVQKILWRSLINRPFNFLNTFYFENESDFLSWTQSGYVYEYEIKISRSDFKADFKKPRFKLLTQCFSGHSYAFIKSSEQAWICTFSYNRYTGSIEQKTEKPGETRFFTRKVDDCISNRFYYVVPTGLISIQECPDFAGLIYVEGNQATEIIKAPLLHKKIHSKQKLFAKMYNSYACMCSKYLKDER